MMSRQPFQQSLRPGKEPGGNGGGEPVRRPASGERASFSQAEECVPWSARDIRAQPVAHANLQDEAVHVACADQTQASFLDGHVRAFHAIGGVPPGMLRYDNLKLR